MTADALIEAVARAIYGRAAARMGHPKPWSLVTSSQRIVWFSDARAALSAIEAAGFRVVPVEPTPEMIAAGMEHREFTGPSGTRWASPVTYLYTAMLSAAPKLTEGGE